MTPEELRARRRALGWTQEAAAAALGLPLRTYHRWEAAGPPAPDLLDAALRWHAHAQRPKRPRRRPRQAQPGP